MTWSERTVIRDGVRTSCRDGGGRVGEGWAPSHFPMRRAWGDVVHACGNRRLYC
ncbi:hypothetical protein [Streptomyces goshikiensis]|uniref:hypothetical protein n=1 Tax=Streptomyces goshikiensis TaxID=1942 RepID=UPI003682AC23